MGVAAITLRGSRARLLPAGLLAFAAAAGVYLFVATRNLELPGVYMDAVNPDYLVVKVLNPAHERIVAWVLEGNYLLGNRVPWMISLYHGSHTFWFGLPLYALFGTTVEGLRLTHAVFALGVLAGLFFLLRRAGLGPLAAAACVTALGVDPSFTYAFRSQSYITLAPSAFVLAGAGLLVPADHRWQKPAWSGFLAGFAAVGYFVQGFLLVALLPALVLVTRGDARRSAVRGRFLAGLALGLAPAFVGYALLMQHVGGPVAFLQFFGREQAALGAFASPQPPAVRLEYAWTILQGVIDNAWLHSMMFREWVPVPGGTLKVACLTALPLGLWLVAEARRTATAALRLCIAAPFAFVAVALVFGNRLGGHHYVIVLPWLYAALALGLRAALVRVGQVARRGASIAALAVWAAATALNAAGQVSEARVLRATGGVDTMSDAIDRYAADLDAMSPKPFVFFPDWGLALPVAFLTRGTVAMDSVENFAAARQELCNGRDVHVALMHDREARATAWAQALEAVPEVRSWRQRDGAVVFDDVAFRASAAHAACANRAPRH